MPKKRIESIEKSANKFNAGVYKIQSDIYSEVIKEISSLSMTGGKLAGSSENIVKINTIGNKIEDYIFSSQYREDLKDYVGSFNNIYTQNNDIFKANFKDFTEKTWYNDIIRASQRNTLELLAKDSVRKEFIIPLTDFLNNSINGTQTFGEAVKTLKVFIEGNSELDGTLLRYVKGITRDAYAIADRRYSTIISNDIGVEWYVYSGGVVRDSRSFCLERVGKYFHRSQIESWAGLDWQGKARGTDGSTIFSLLGGYNCMHVLIPVSTQSVPLSYRNNLK